MPPVPLNVQVKRSPVITLDTPPTPATSTGVRQRVAVVGHCAVLALSPSCPKVLAPQHFIVPPGITAQVWPNVPCPPASAVAPKGRFSTLTGLGRVMVELSPSCPSALAPQQTTPPAEL